MIFFSDLDNTLIHSYKRARVGDICVETRDGKELSFMPPGSYEMLQNAAESVEFVPVTTRSAEQYRRLTMLRSGGPRFALVCNGAILLDGGEIDEKWSDKSRMSFHESLVRLPGYKYLADGWPDLFRDARLADGFFMFAKPAASSDVTEVLNRVVDCALFDIHFAFEKVYIMPRGLTKGAAVSRFLRTRSGCQYSVSAGDGELDLSMLQVTDGALVPRGYPYHGANFERAQGEDFCEFVLTRVKGLVQSLRQD
jgi:hydroxymethylpyrimidine pyrophosphatase-like HAD family hydrolase